MGAMKHGRWIAFFLTIMLMITITGCQTLARKKAEPLQSLSFKLAELDSGKVVNFPADYQGEKVLLTFFGLG